MKLIVDSMLVANPDFGVVVYRLMSDFKGQYYNRFDRPTTIEGKRPYFIWIFGSRQNLVKLRNAVPETKFKNGVTHSLMFSGEAKKIDYAIIPGSGSFSPNKQDSKSALDKPKLTKSRNPGESSYFEFVVQGDLSRLLQDESYIIDASNYELSNKSYKLSVSKNGSYDKYTHKFKLKSQGIYPGTLSIKLKSKLPTWFDEISDDDDTNINLGESMNKTDRKSVV